MANQTIGTEIVNILTQAEAKAIAEKNDFNGDIHVAKVLRIIAEKINTAAKRGAYSITYTYTNATEAAAVNEVLSNTLKYVTTVIKDYSTGSTGVDTTTYTISWHNAS